MAARRKQTRSPRTAAAKPKPQDREPQDYVDVAEKYARDVVAGTVVAGKRIRQACQRHLDDLKRADKDASWGYHFDRWHGNDVCDFIEKLPHIEGVWETPTITLEPPQVFLLVVIFGWRRNRDGGRRFSFVYIEMARKGAKALDLDTPIPTPDGWRRMGSLEIGDRVFDERGRLCNVVARSEIFADHDCFEVEFSDGERIVADAGHLWRTAARRKGNGINGKRRTAADDIRTTAQIAATLSAGNGRRVEWNHSIPVAGALQLLDASLPIPPYTLGAWLGDGHSASARVTICHGDEQILDAIRAEGIDVKRSRSSEAGASLYLLGSHGRGAVRRDSLQAQLRAAGLLNDRRIPPLYLRASERQRLELLRGLMDTDGTICKRGKCSITTVYPALRDGIMELLRSLGFKPMASEERATIDGRDCGPCWRIRFIGRAERPVFHLERKRARLKPSPASGTARSSTRQIVACSRVASRPVRCIQVDSPSRLYLAGRSMVPTHNSTLTGGVTLYCTACEGEVGPQVVIGATTRDQANKVFLPAKRMVEWTPALQEAFGFKAWASAIECASNGGYIQPINAKGSTQDGHNPHLSVLDELHAHKSRALFDVIKSARGARKNRLMWIITTAGFNLHGVCYEQRTYAIKVLDGALVADHVFAAIFSLDDDDDVFDERVWVKANPMLGVTPTLESMREDAADARASPDSLANFKTKNCNRWLGAASGWLSPEAWKLCSRPELDWDAFEGLECWAGGDLADKDDITALALIAIDSRGRLLIKPKFFLPLGVLDAAEASQGPAGVPYRRWLEDGTITPSPGDWVDHNTVEETIRQWRADFSLRGVVFDQFAAAQAMASRLNEDGNPDRPFASILHKKASNVTDPAKELASRVKAGPKMLLHDGNECLSWMASNVVVDQRTDGTILPKKESQMSPNKIDGIDAIVNALKPLTEPDTRKKSYLESGPLLVI